jgi:hypothetical protein
MFDEESAWFEITFIEVERQKDIAKLIVFAEHKEEWALEMQSIRLIEEGIDKHLKISKHGQIEHLQVIHRLNWSHLQ